MNFSFGSLVGSMLVSGVGIVFFKYGRKRSDSVFVIVGVVMMIYPYFVSDFWWMLGIAAAMSAFLYWRGRYS